MPYRGATLLLSYGRIAIKSDSIEFLHEQAYGKNTEFLKFFVLSYVKLLCDSPLKASDGDKPIQVYTRFLRHLLGYGKPNPEGKVEDLPSTIKRFSSLAHDILSNDYVTGGESSIRPFFPGMKDTPIFKEYLSWYKTGRPDLLKYIVSFLTFGKKLEYEDEIFHTTAFRGWNEVEERLHALQFRTVDLVNLNKIVRELLPPLPVDHLLPRFGPGNVSERGIKDVYDKLGNLSSHPRLEYAFFRSRPGRSSDQGFRPWAMQHSGSSIEESRLKFVPKDITKSRSICMEPNAFMLFQQEVLRWMRNGMEIGKIRDFVDMTDQTRSQLAAVHGSTYLSTDTIDLSSASDSVHLDLVKGIFPRDWLFYLLATRTSLTEVPQGEKIRRLMKFAPMGSAVCFPTQCIIFTAVCIYAAMAYASGEDTGTREFGQGEISSFLKNGFTLTRTPHTPFSRRLEPPVVYGDDIAVDSRTTARVVSTLDRLGFSVNRSKSFVGSQATRESCGVFANRGEDVTPVLFRLPFFNKGKWDSKVFASFIGGINQMRANGFNSVAALWLSVLEDYGFKHPLPFVTDTEDFGMFTKNLKRPSEQHLVWHPNWQCYMRRMQGIGPRVERKLKKHEVENHALYSYDQWWRIRARGGSRPDEDRGRLRVRPEKTRLVPRWARYES